MGVCLWALEFCSLSFLQRASKSRPWLEVDIYLYIYISFSLTVLKIISNDIARAIQVCGCSRRPASTQQRLRDALPQACGTRAWPSLLLSFPPRVPGRPAVARSSVTRVSAHWFNSSAQTCCGQPVRPLILFSPGPRAGGKPSCCGCQRTHRRKEARKIGLDCSAPITRLEVGVGSKVLGAVTGAFK